MVVPWSVVDGAAVAGCSVVVAGVITSFEVWSPNQPLFQPIMASTITTAMAPKTVFLFCVNLSIVSSLALTAGLIECIWWSSNSRSRYPHKTETRLKLRPDQTVTKAKPKHRLRPRVLKDLLIAIGNSSHDPP